MRASPARRGGPATPRCLLLPEGGGFRPNQQDFGSSVTTAPVRVPAPLAAWVALVEGAMSSWHSLPRAAAGSGGFARPTRRCLSGPLHQAPRRPRCVGYFPRSVPREQAAASGAAAAEGSFHGNPRNDAGEAARGVGSSGPLAGVGPRPLWKPAGKGASPGQVLSRKRSGVG